VLLLLELHFIFIYCERGLGRGDFSLVLGGMGAECR